MNSQNWKLTQFDVYNDDVYDVDNDVYDDYDDDDYENAWIVIERPKLKISAVCEGYRGELPVDIDDNTRYTADKYKNTNIYPPPKNLVWNAKPRLDESTLK